MKKLILIFFVLLVVQKINAQDSSQVRISVRGTIKNVSEKGEYVSVISKDKERKTSTAFLYDRTSREIISIGEPDKDLMFAEYVKQFNYYIVILRGFESYEGYLGSPDIIKAIDVVTGNIAWENNANAGRYETSPDGTFLITKSPAEDDRKGSFVIINLIDGSKITLEEKIQNYRATWLTSNKVLITQNERKKILPEDRIKEYKNWGEELSARERKASNDFNNKKITKTEYENLENEFSNEFFKRTNEYLDLISKETKYITTSRILIYNIATKMVEKDKLLIDNSGNNIIIDYNEDPINIVNTDEDQNIYLNCRLDSKSDEENIYYFVKYDKDLSLRWKTEFLPLTTFYQYLLDQRPFYGFLLTDRELFVDPENGNIVSYEELKKKISDIPTITTLKKSGRSFYNNNSRIVVDPINNNIILK